MNKEYSRVSFAFWLLIVFCFVLVPAFLLMSGVARYCELYEENRRKDLKVGLQQVLTACIRNLDSEKYWGRKLSEKFNEFTQSSISIDKTLIWLQKQRMLSGGRIDFIVWNRYGEVVFETSDELVEKEALSELYIELGYLDFFNNVKKFTRGIRSNLDVIRRSLGPQYIGRMLEAVVREKAYGLAHVDSASGKKLVWAYRTGKAVYLLFFDPEISNDRIGLVEALEFLDKGRTFHAGVFDKSTNEIIALSEDTEGLNEDLLRGCALADENLSGEAETAGFYLVSGFLNKNMRVFVYAQVYYASAFVLLLAGLGGGVWCLLMLPFIHYTWRTILLRRPGTISIRPRIAFVFIFAAAVPFMVMSVFAREHYSQKSDTGLKDAFQRSMSLLQNYDIRMQSLVSRLEHQIKNVLSDWTADMEGKQLDDESNEKILHKSQDLNVTSYFVVGSSTNVIATKNGLVKANEKINEKDLRSSDSSFDESGSSKEKKKKGADAQIVNIIGKRILNELNGLSESNKGADKMELFIESLLQKSFAEITHSFIKAMGGISPWGFGISSNLALLDFMSAGDSGRIDYMALFLWNGPDIQRYYVEATIADINRNSLGLRVAVFNHYAGNEMFPADFDLSEGELKEFIGRINEQPTEEIEIVNYRGEPHIAMGFIGKELFRYKLIGLYPLNLLYKRVSRQRGDIILLSVFCLLLTAWLAHMLSQSFLSPLRDLYSAAVAVEKRNFQHRIEEKRKDEFGEVAEIFNNVLVSLEELEIAKVVQESLFPQQVLEAGKIKIFGKSLAMSELGGDYFDYFSVDETRVAALMGDVAGHGVGAALIMAMAKAGVISSSDLLAYPAKLLARLHGLIYGSKTRKQKKIMTFQYILADIVSGRVVYSNAGGCSPIVVKGGGKGEELTLAGAALGAFKKATFNELEFEIASGEMIVFYTDGIIEARDAAGREMGYDGFAQLVSDSIDSDPERAYEKICAGYMNHISGLDAQDDLTMVVICCS